MGASENQPAMVAKKASKKAGLQAVVPDKEPEDDDFDPSEEHDFVRKLKNDISNKLKMIETVADREYLEDRYTTYLSMEKDLTGAPGGTFEKKLFSVQGEIDKVLLAEEQKHSKDQQEGFDVVKKKFNKNKERWKTLKILLLFHFLFMTGMLHVVKWQNVYPMESRLVMAAWVLPSCLVVLLGHFAQSLYPRNKCSIVMFMLSALFICILKIVAIVSIIMREDAATLSKYIMAKIPFFIEIVILFIEFFIMMNISSAHSEAKQMDERPGLSTSEPDDGDDAP